MDNFSRKQSGLPYIDDENCDKQMRENTRKLHEYIEGNTAQLTASAFVIRLLAYFPA
ncbi:MAG: hypothetical protein MR364_03440 [Oscillospiraceae bacterium]|nr:hypothetical protein [Oscillospiraceae bacterium]